MTAVKYTVLVVLVLHSVSAQGRRHSHQVPHYPSPEEDRTAQQQAGVQQHSIDRTVHHQEKVSSLLAEKLEHTNDDTSSDDAVDPCAVLPCVNGSCAATGNSSSSYICVCSPYLIGKNCDQEALINVANGRCNANCTASSSNPGNPCFLAIDQVDDVNGWATNQRTGSWIRVDFGAYYRINGLLIFDRCIFSHQTKSITVSGRSDITESFELVCIEDQSLACPGGYDYYWQRFDLTSTITDHIRVDITDVCDTNTNSTDVIGFREIKVFGYEVALSNVALLENGATCTASSEYDAMDYSCNNALDGVEDPGPGNEWASSGEGNGAWINIALNRNSTVMAVGFLQRCDQIEQNKILTLSFSDSTSQQVTLDCFTGLNPTDCTGQYWQHFDLDPYVITDFIRVELTEVCTTRYNGFREIRVFAIKDEA